MFCGMPSRRNIYIYIYIYIYIHRKAKNSKGRDFLQKKKKEKKSKGRDTFFLKRERDTFDKQNIDTTTDEILPYYP